MFKNLMIYRLPKAWAMSVEALSLLLAGQAFQPCTSAELQRMGWVPPREGGALVHTANRQLLLRLRVEKKLLPASVIKEAAKARADELEELQGFRPGRKAMRELKEIVADELLPRAFGVLSNTWVWIDPVNGWLVVDTPSVSRADDAIKLLLKAVVRLPLESLRVKQTPVASMTGWLDADEAPRGFTIDQDAEMASAGASNAKVRYVKHTLEAADIRRHIAAGKQCTRVGLTWRNKISFVLTETLAIKSVRQLDVLREGEAGMQDSDERFDNDFMLMSGETAQLLADLVGALGGEVDDLASAAMRHAA